MAKASLSPVYDSQTYTLFYVSPNGRDNWSGQCCSPGADGNDGPFATIAAARDAIRRLKQSAGGVLGKPVAVLILGGTYYLTDTIRFTPEDSGTAECPIIYTAHPGQSVTLSGGVELSGWNVTQLEGKTCWTLDIPDVASGQWRFTQLFVDGQRQARTRLPRTGFHRFIELPEGRKGLFTGVTTAKFNAGDFRNWKNLQDVSVTAMHHWYENHVHVQAVDDATQTVTFQHPSISDLWDEDGKPSRYWIENVFEAMTEPGDWYLDRSIGRLYYLPLAHQTPANTRVVAPVLSHFIQFKGSAEAKVSHIQLENLRFRHAEWRLPISNPGAVQAAYNVPGSITLYGAEDCVIYQCEISQISQYAIEIQRNSSRNQVIACHLFDLGAGGVKVNSERPLVKSLVGLQAFRDMDPTEYGWDQVEQQMSTEDPSLIGSRSTISDCTIHDGGIIFPSAIGVWVGDAGRNRVRHNHVYNFYYSGMSCGWTWGYAPTRTVDNRFEYNHIHDIGRGVLSDMGAIYTLGAQPGTVLRNNVVHDINSNGYGGWGLYTDEGSAGVVLENNIVYRTKSGGLHQNYGRDNLIRNNIFCLASQAQIILGSTENVRAWTFQRNIVYHTSNHTVSASGQHVVFDRNLYWREDGLPTAFGLGLLPLDQWHQLGQDTHSIIADPILGDPRAGNMSLPLESPARDIGFRGIDVSKVGPRHRVSRPASYSQWPKDVDTPATIVQAIMEPGTAEEVAAQAQIHGTARPPIGIVDAKARTAFCLMLRNAGEIPAVGGFKLQIFPKNAGKLEGDAIIAYELQPGEKRATTIWFTPSGKSETFHIEANPTDKSVLSTALYMGLRARWLVRSVQTATIDEVFEKVQNTPARFVQIGASPACEVRLGVCGDQLAFLFKVTDRLMKRGTSPWQDTSIELFTAMPGINTVTQVFLVPALNGLPDQASMMTPNGSVPAPEIQLRSRPTDIGYEMAALIPFAQMKLEPETKSFMFETIVGVTPADSTNVLRNSILNRISLTNPVGFLAVEVIP